MNLNMLYMLNMLEKYEFILKTFISTNSKSINTIEIFF